MAKASLRAPMRVLTKVTPAVLSALVVATGASFAVQDGAGAPTDSPESLDSGDVPVTRPLDVDRPASVSTAGDGERPSARTTASISGVPDAALAAYQRAASVLGASDPGCRLDWTLMAAIGQVESNHGQFGGSTLNTQGLAKPSIIGLPLNGRNKTRAIRDTDAGRLDTDRRWDRAVGPMQFIPSTWSLVGVDADGDNRRNPQDIDDAALATAVYLCSGKDDLSTDKGRDAALLRYNNSQSYVTLVTSLADRFASADADTAVIPTVVTPDQVEEVDEVKTRKLAGPPIDAAQDSPRSESGRVGDEPHRHGGSDDSKVGESGSGHDGGQTSGKVPDQTEGPSATKPDGSDDEPSEEPTEPETTDPETNGPDDSGTTDPDAESTGPETTDPETTGPGDGETSTPTPSGPSEGPEATEVRILSPEEIAAYDAEVLEAAVAAVTEAGYVDDPGVLTDSYDLALSTYLVTGELPDESPESE